MSRISLNNYMCSFNCTCSTAMDSQRDESSSLTQPFSFADVSLRVTILSQYFYVPLFLQEVDPRSSDRIFLDYVNLIWLFFKSNLKPGFPDIP